MLRVLNVPGGVSEIMSIEMDRQVSAAAKLPTLHYRTVPDPVLPCTTALYTV